MSSTGHTGPYLLHIQTCFNDPIINLAIVICEIEGRQDDVAIFLEFERDTFLCDENFEVH